MMHKRYFYAILLLFFVSSTSFSQIWLVRNVSNVFLDDCYISFGNKVGIAYCLPERYVEPVKLDDWNDSALCYVLYPVYPLVMNIDTNNADTVKKSKHRRSKKQATAQKDAAKDSLQANEAPKWKISTADSLTLAENGKIIYTYEDILVYKTYKPLQETDITTYRPFQLFKPVATTKLLNSDR